MRVGFVCSHNQFVGAVAVEVSEASNASPSKAVTGFNAACTFSLFYGGGGCCYCLLLLLGAVIMK